MTTDVDQVAEMRPELDEALLGLDQLAQENPDEALAMFDTLPEPVKTLPDFQLVLARTRQGLGELDEARRIAQAVVDQEEEHADAHHLLGDLLEDLKDEDGANRHFLRTLALDKIAYETHSEIPSEKLLEALTKILKATCEELPEEYRSPFQAQLFPSEDDVKNGVDPRALSIWSHGNNEKGRLVLYGANLDAEYGDLNEFNEFGPHVSDTIRAEITHHLQLSDEVVAKLGWQESEPPPRRASSPPEFS